MRRYVLYVLSSYGDQEGRDIFPSTREIARATGLSRRAVEGHLREAEGVWITRAAKGEGRGWKRHQYQLMVPDTQPTPPGGGEHSAPPQGADVEREVPHHGADVGNDAPHANGARRGASHARRGEADDIDVGHHVPTTSPKTSPKTSPGSNHSGIQTSRVSDGGERVRDVLKSNCFLGAEWVELHGHRMGVEHLVRQFETLLEIHDLTADELVGIVERVRSDEDAPGPDEPFTLRWLLPARLSRLQGAALKHGGPARSTDGPTRIGELSA